MLKNTTGMDDIIKVTPSSSSYVDVAYFEEVMGERIEELKKHNIFSNNTNIVDQTSVRTLFEKILKNNNWSNIKWIKKPILSDGRRAKKIFFKLLSLLFYPFVFIKYFDELFMGRICVICKK